MNKRRERMLKANFKKRVHHWAKELEVDVLWLAVRPMRRKWASCSTNGHLHFSSELLELNEALWDYVIVHELLHFSVPNHGKLWKSLMRAHLGEYEVLVSQLKEEAHKRLKVKKASGPEPQQLKEGKEFHKKIQQEWEDEAEGKVKNEKQIEKPSGQKGRIDVFADAGEAKALVEIKNTNWDQMTDQAVQRNVRSYIKQIWDYIDSQPNEANGICPGITFPKRPKDPERLQWIEDTFIEEGIPVVWHDESIEELKQRKRKVSI